MALFDFLCKKCLINLEMIMWCECGICLIFFNISKIQGNIGFFRAYPNSRAAVAVQQLQQQWALSAAISNSSKQQAGALLLPAASAGDMLLPAGAAGALLLPAPAACSVYEFNLILNWFKIVTKNEIVISIKCKGGVLVGIMSVRMKTFIK